MNELIPISKVLRTGSYDRRRSTTASYFLLNFATRFDADFNKCPNLNLNSQDTVYVDMQ